MKVLGLCIAAGLGLSACAMTGNTDQNNNANRVVTQYPVEAAILNIYTKQRSDKLIATVGNQSVSAEIQVTPKGSMRFNNKAVQGAEVNTINKVNDRITDQSVAINYFTLNPLVFHGFTDSTGKYSLSNQTTVIPKIATVGDSSKLITENIYTNSSMRNKIGTYNQDWSLARDTNNTAWFCIETSGNLLLSSDPAGTSSECYKINAKGDLLASKVTLNQPSSNGSARTVTLTSQ
ncbi:hypothetical protein ACQKDA_04960 [Psychrobacter sp. NPDC078370]|uniref:hypothetical protein n=1 Tax=Psychrobacter TaxID=497 RepID=UPI000C7EEAE9|nr:MULTISPECIES: hypothetical protein [Psychrobacter]PLT22154.1 hypothetical protein CXF62_06515 [Psychrobacter sp. MES7-P7E]|tara:strand:+ start:63 stop:764 length:702 start_codon:yes stop_codon:yes gene_type:complete